jgi:hypothetical protein
MVKKHLRTRVESTSNRIGIFCENLASFAHSSRTLRPEKRRRKGLKGSAESSGIDLKARRSNSLVL